MIIPDDQTFGIGDHIDITLSHPYSVDVTGTPRLNLTIGSKAEYADFLAGDKTRFLTFRYTVKAGDMDLNGIALNNIVDLNGGSMIFSYKGKLVDAETSLDNIPSTKDLLVDTIIPTQLAITEQPTDTDRDATISPSITIEIRDDANNLVTNASNQVSVSFATDPSSGSASIGGTTMVTAVNGVAIFDDLNIDVIESGYTLSFSASGLSAVTSDSFDITQPPATQLVITKQPADSVAGIVNSSTITVEFRDASNQLVPTENSEITVALGSDPSSGAATLGGDLDVNASSGVATFSDLTIDKAFENYALTFSGSGLTSITSNTFDINPNTKSLLAFSVQPSNTGHNIAITPSIQVSILDAYGNVTLDNDPITLSIANNPNAGTPSGDLTVAAVGGIATFNNISIDNAGVGYTLAANATGLTSANSNSFDITAVPTQLVITQQPTNTDLNTDISPAITVEIRDASNNLVNSTALVTLALGTDPSAGAANLSGDLDVNAVGGIATFSDIQLDVVDTGYTLVASATGLTDATSNTFDITQPPATQLVITQQPNNSLAGDNITPAITVEFRDASNNLVSSETSEVTVTIGSDPSSSTATLGGDLDINAVGGIATFSDLNLDKAFDNYTLTFSSTGITGATSSTFNIDPNTKSSLSFVFQPSNADPNTAITPAIQVEILDAYGNRTADNNTIDLAINNNPSAGTLGGTVSVAASNGLASFSNITINNAGDGYTLDATATDLTSATSSSFNIIAPVSLAFQDDTEYDFGEKAQGSSTDLTVVIDYSGSGSATITSSINPSADFLYKGGSYPGTGGTCGASITSNCIVVISYAPTSAAVHSATLSLSYDNGSSIETITKPLTGEGTNNPPTKLVVTGAASGVITSECIPFTIKAQDSSSSSSNVTSDETVTLIVNNGTGSFYSDDTCSSLVTSTTITSGNSSQDIYFQSNTVGQNLTLVFNGSSLTNTSHIIATANEPVDIFVSASAEVEVDDCSALEVSLVDSSGVKTGSSSAKTVSIDNPGDAIFYNDSFCTGALSSIEFAAYEGTRNIFIKNSTIESSTITFEDNITTLNSTDATIDFVSTLTWWDNNWLKRKKITISNIDQATSFTDMPVLIKLSSNRINYNNFLADGTDIRFVADDHTTVLSHNIESWDNTSESFIWVKLPSISASSAIDIYIYYDNTAASDIDDASSVFTAFQGTWNMDQNDRSEYIDSTGSGKDAIEVGTLTNITGPIGGGVSFDESSELDTGFALETIIGRTSTLSLWVKTTQVGNNTNWLAPGITGVEQAGGRNDIFFGFIRADGSIAVNSGNSGVAASNFVINDNTWRHIAFQRNETSGEVRFYINGVLNGTGTSETGYKSSAFSSFGVIADTGGSPEYFNGSMDGIRLSDSYLSPEEIKAQFKFQADTNISFGSLEEL